MKTLYRRVFQLIILILCCWFIETKAIHNDDVLSPIVRTSWGKIQGTVLKTLNGKDIYAYRGIRYAQAPVKDLRFKAPLPEKRWRGTLNATTDSLMCPQLRVPEYMISEDCLKLNVFTRNLKAKAPVIFYIHGGANIEGSGDSAYEAGPQYLMDHNVVFVAINYRLGALGFANTKTKEYPGNYAYLDQLLALKWVKKHICHFGGDPNNVTILGMSAGSMAVTLHLASPLSKGLFHKAIGMSGSAINHYHIDNLHYTQKLSREVGCPQYDPIDMMECLKNVSWQKILDNCHEWNPYGFINMKWSYEIDGIFLPEDPAELFRKGNYSQVPLILGFTLNEFDYSVQHQENNTLLLDDITKNFNLYAPELFSYQQEKTTQSPSKGDLIRQFYFKDEPSINSQNLIKLGNIFSDSIIGHGIYRLVKLVSQYQTVYYYRMDYPGRRSIVMDVTGKPKGMGHADDLQYIMPSIWNGLQFARDDPDIMMVNRLTNLWTSFAANGIPVSPDMIEWKPFEPSQKQMLYNNITAYMGPPAYTERFQLWDDLFSEGPTQ